ncbi:hypothetical protein BBJ28_00017673 [Nothophytophthora sp. Chile5]|nr:hypothetical protein BBJ28_00017673 [Nothophytophthora sp. Chile5]
MTIAGDVNTQGVDFFSLHTRKKKAIDVDMLDYRFVEQSSDVDELKGILVMLRSGKEGRYPDLERATEDRILAVLPERERNKIQCMRSGPSSTECMTEGDELANWAAVMDLKNEALKRQASVRREMPPVRGQAPSAVADSALLRTSATVSAAENSDQEKPKAIPAYDFRAWEKYNVDEALKEIDQGEAQARKQAKLQQQEQEKRVAARKKELEALPRSVILEKLELETRKVYAGHEKQKGNDCFKANELEMALLHYTRSMAYDDSDAILYANRALVYLRVKSFAAAEDDCSRAILLDPLYTKAWSRRGMTRYRRGKYAESAQDFEKALQLEPGSREVMQLLKKAQEKHEEVNGGLTNRQETQNIGDAQPVEDSYSQKPFVRFEIIEDDEDDEDDEGAEVNSDQSSSNQDSHDEQTAGGRASEHFTRFEIIEAEDEEADEDDDPLEHKA